MRLKAGDKFSCRLRPARQEDLNRFGALHGTTGKTHTDPEYARSSVFGGVIVQGALVMAPVFDICGEILGPGWLERSEVEAKFVALTRPGDVVTVEIDVVRVRGQEAELAYACVLPDGKKVQVGTVSVRASATEETPA